jgi:hypothetical protein
MLSIVELSRSVLSDWIPKEDVPQLYILYGSSSDFPTCFSRLGKTQACTTHDTLVAFFPLSTHIPQETPRESFFRIGSKTSLYIMFGDKQWLLWCAQCTGRKNNSSVWKNGMMGRSEHRLRKEMQYCEYIQKAVKTRYASSSIT